MLKMARMFIVFILFLFLIPVACGDKNKGETPDQAVANALTAIKKIDIDNIQKYFVFEDLFVDNLEAEEIVEDIDNARLLVDKLNFKIISSSTEGDIATVKTEITNTDMSVILDEYVQQAMALAFSNAFAGDAAKSEQEMKNLTEQLFIDLLSRKDNKMTTSIVDIKLSKSDTGWKLNINEELQDAVFGGFVSAAKTIDERFDDSNSPESKLKEISNFISSDIWGDGFCNISWYIAYGTGSTGESLDIDFTLEQLADTMAKKIEYDDYISSLEDEKYAKVKRIWGKLSPEIDRLYSQLQEKKPVASDSSYDFDTGLFNQYMDAFTDEVWELD